MVKAYELEIRGGRMWICSKEHRCKVLKDCGDHTDIKLLNVCEYR